MITKKQRQKVSHKIEIILVKMKKMKKWNKSKVKEIKNEKIMLN